MAHFYLVTQQPKPKQLGLGCLSIDNAGTAQFFEGDADANSRVMAEMVRVRIEWAAAAGIFLSGMELDGIDRYGRPKYKLQEWLLRHINPNQIGSGAAGSGFTGKHTGRVLHDGADGGCQLLPTVGTPR